MGASTWRATRNDALESTVPATVALSPYDPTPSRAPAGRGHPDDGRRDGSPGRGDEPTWVRCQILSRPRARPRTGQPACDVRRRGGQGRGRTADLPIFSRTLVPTELPGRVHPRGEA